MEFLLGSASPRQEILRTQICDIVRLELSASVGITYVGDSDRETEVVHTKVPLHLLHSLIVQLKTVSLVRFTVLLTSLHLIQFFEKYS